MTTRVDGTRADHHVCVRAWRTVAPPPRPVPVCLVSATKQTSTTHNIAPPANAQTAYAYLRGVFVNCIRLHAR